MHLIGLIYQLRFHFSAKCHAECRRTIESLVCENVHISRRDTEWCEHLSVIKPFIEESDFQFILTPTMIVIGDLIQHCI